MRHSVRLAYRVTHNLLFSPSEKNLCEPLCPLITVVHFWNSDMNFSSNFSSKKICSLHQNLSWILLYKLKCTCNSVVAITVGQPLQQIPAYVTRQNGPQINCPLRLSFATLYYHSSFIQLFLQKLVEKFLNHRSNSMKGWVTLHSPFLAKSIWLKDIT